MRIVIAALLFLTDIIDKFKKGNAQQSPPHLRETTGGFPEGEE